MERWCLHWMESRVSIGWRVGVSIGWRGGVSIQWRGASPLDGEVGSPLDGDLQVDCRVVGGCLRQVKTSSPGPFGASPVFAMWQNRSDQFYHFSSTSLTLGFDQGKVLLFHAPRYMDLNGHVTLT